MIAAVRLFFFFFFFLLEKRNGKKKEIFLPLDMTEVKLDREERI